MSRDVPEWVKPGVELIERNYSGWSGRSYGARRRIAKVHANGNFKTESDDQQWRPRHDGTASKTGGGYYHQSLVRVTPELEVEIARSKALSKARVVVATEAKRLDQLSRDRDEDAILAAAEAIRALSDRSGDTGGDNG